MSRISAIARPTILRRRALARDRQRARRARLARGERFLALNIEIAPGVTLLQARIDEAMVEDWLVETGRLEAWQADFSELILEAIKIFLARIGTGASRVTSRPAASATPSP